MSIWLKSIKKLLSVFVATIFGLILVEAVLQIAYLASGNVKAILSPPNTPNGEIRTRVMVPHQSLKFIGNSSAFEIDDLGFRNRKSLSHPDIIVLGDSQTFGYSVQREEAWPHILSELTNLSVYNMAIPGYGPGQSLLLRDYIASAKPKLVIQAVYSGNDLRDCVELVDRLGWDRILTEQGTLDSDNIEHPTHDESINYATSAHLPLFRKILSRYCKSYGLIRRVRVEFIRLGKQIKQSKLNLDQKWVAAQDSMNESEFAFHKDKVRTIFTPERRLYALNLELEEVQSGFKYLNRITTELSDFCEAQNIEFAVLFIPTKEHVYSNFDELFENEIYNLLIPNEISFWDQYKRDLDMKGIRFYNPIESMQNAVVSGEPLYYETDNGHPSPIGHSFIARFLFDNLQTN